MAKEYKPIEGYEDHYEVSDYGDVRNIKTKRLISQSLTSNKYYKVKLSKHGIVTTFRVHRLVAIAFIDNPLDYPYIDHVNEDRLDNHIHNLRWCDQAMNIDYYWAKRR